MLWSIREAVERQTVQIGASACGATAVVDVLKALGVEVPPEEADRCVRTRLRRNESPLPDYLLSRSEAGQLSQQWALKGATVIEFFSSVTPFFFSHWRLRRLAQSRLIDTHPTSNLIGRSFSYMVG